MLSHSHSTGKLFPFIINMLKGSLCLSPSSVIEMFSFSLTRYLFIYSQVTANEPFTPTFQALFSTHIVGEKPILIRDFIHSALYDPSHGYFSQRSGSVGVLDRSLKFNNLEGRKAYMKHLDKIYKQSGIAWFAPVELFKPWYAWGIAEAIMRTANLSVPLKIYEIGGGSGTCAKGIMDYLMLNAPSRVYNSMTYTSVEISPALAEIQIQTVGEVHSHLSKFKVEYRDAMDRSGWARYIFIHGRVWLVLQDKDERWIQYNPLLDDFKNIKFYLSVPMHNTK